jgi:hypothetical protein
MFQKYYNHVYNLTTCMVIQMAKTKVISLPSLEDLEEQVKRKYGDATVRVYGPLSTFFHNLLNKVFSQLPDATTPVTLEDHDMTSAMMTKIASQIKTAGETGDEVAIVIKNKNEITPDDNIGVLREINQFHDAGNFILIVDETDNINDDSNLENQITLESAVINNGGVVYRAIIK